MSGFKERISTVLLARRVATKEQLDRLLAESSRNGKSFARLLIDRKIISEATLTELLSKELAIPMISLAKYRIDPAVARLIPERWARQHHLIALSKFGERLVVAMADPLDIFAIDDLKALTQVAIDPVLSPESEIRRAIEQAYAGQALSAGASDATEEAAGQGEGDLTLDSAVALLLNETGEAEAPVIRVINRLVIESMRRHASDIHLEPGEDALRVRYRIDGRLMEAHRLPKAVQSALLTRLKIMSGLDITEWRLPQDGRFKVRLDEREVDFRVSVLPIAGGGKVVLRLLDQANLSIGLDHLGFLPESIEQFKAAVKRPYGMILVTGPTGSGKSTTLYSILNQLNQPTKNLLTIEDPVEYQVEGIIQMQVNVEVGLTFAGGLRAILRQSPDVIMIGEIRDFETADIAMKASLTGQLVLSTLHTNDAPSAVTRLIDMGVEPFLVASSVNLIEAQRLVRKLCTKCREPFDPSPAALERLNLHPAKDATFFKAVGCRFCNNTGYRGRMGIIETFQIDDRVRELVVSRAQSWEIKDYAVKALGMTPLRQDGLKKAERGV
ncbi:MAG: Flp pilus assembly complex ATPase component TadA, partial [Candidatus Omnitrophica bacterium]|nr:Flp pilus assembly complex ATPase component TadA [Candidatus Omnitrophota bacterium]